MDPMTQDDIKLEGDLSSLPSRDRWLWDEEIYAVDQLIHMSSIDGAPVTSQIVAAFHAIIHDRRQLLEKELQEREFMTQIIKGEVHHQLRARSDHRQGDIAVEQWVPALQCWIVCSRFDLTTSTSKIVEDLRAGDPRFKTAQERYDEARTQSAATRARLDAESSQKVMDAVSSLSSDRIDRFIAVEEALKTGESISAREDDRRFIEAATERTKSAAAAGDIESQRVLTHGVRDTPLCVNPADNPTIR